MKKTTYRQYTDKQQINNALAYLRLCNIPHRHILTNYTTTIETPTEIYKFVNKDMSTRAFIGAQKVKDDLVNWSANERPHLNTADNRYFEFSDYSTELNAANVFCIDIKSAYATILLNDGFISQDTFNFINALPKADRLACIGMLASRKSVFYFHGKELTGFEEIVNENQNYFWYCVQRTNYHMNKIKSLCKSTIFYWVDGIYFKTLCDARRAAEYLTSEKMRYSLKNCLDFYHCYDAEKDNYKIFFYENSREKCNLKLFTLPKENEIKKILTKYFLNKININN